jgi:hypothetical protein
MVKLDVILREILPHQILPHQILPQHGVIKGSSWVSWVLAATAIVAMWGPAAFAADRYWDTSNTTGLQGGSGSLNGSNWSTNVSGTGTRTGIGSSNDVFFQATEGSLTYTGTFNTSTPIPTTLTIGNWTVANGNAVTSVNNSSQDGSATFNISGTILVTGSSSMTWALSRWTLAGTPALTISESSTNTLLGNAAGGGQGF